MKHIQLLLLAIATSITSGCGMMDRAMESMGAIDIDTPMVFPIENHIDTRNFIKNDICPKIEISQELRSLSNYTNIEGVTDGQLTSYISIENVEIKCHYNEDGVTVDVKLELNGKISDATSNIRSFTYPYFLAIISPDDKILAKDIYKTSISHNQDGEEKLLHENIRKFIPIINKNEGKNYKIVVGFQLSKKQLSYNRVPLNN